MKKLLILTHTPRPINIDRLFAALATRFDTRVVALDKEACKNISPVLQREQAAQYDHVLLDIPFKRLYRQASAVKKLGARAIIYEEDATQNCIAQSQWCGVFEKFYAKVPQAIVINTGYRTSEYFRRRGVRSYCVPKGFDPARIYPEPVTRDIPLGFIGRLATGVYQARKQAIETMVAEQGLQLLRTASADEYRTALSRIQVFFSADIGLHEYMAKNFEAMAAGCVLLAFCQGDGEERALGFEDGVNVVLYTSLVQAVEKIQWLQAHPAESEVIAKRGLALVQERNTMTQLGERIADIIEQPKLTKGVAPQ